MKTSKRSVMDDQFEMRQTFQGGFAGQLVAGMIWLIAATVSVVFTDQAGMVVLFFGCMGIFPLTKLVLFFIGQDTTINQDNRLFPLGAQVAFMVPINFLLVGAIILYKPIWFFPATMIIVGSHYLPFMTLYGMKLFGILAILLILAGTGLALYGPPIFSLGGWIAGVLFIVFAAVGKYQVTQETALAQK